MDPSHPLPGVVCAGTPLPFSCIVTPRASPVPGTVLVGLILRFRKTPEKPPCCYPALSPCLHYSVRQDTASTLQRSNDTEATPSVRMQTAVPAGCSMTATQFSRDQKSGTGGNRHLSKSSWHRRESKPSSGHSGDSIKLVRGLFFLKIQREACLVAGRGGGDEGDESPCKIPLISPSYTARESEEHKKIHSLHSPAAFPALGWALICWLTAHTSPLAPQLLIFPANKISNFNIKTNCFSCKRSRISDAVYIKQRRMQTSQTKLCSGLCRPPPTAAPAQSAALLQNCTSGKFTQRRRRQLKFNQSTTPGNALSVREQ